MTWKPFRTSGANSEPAYDASSAAASTTIILAALGLMLAGYLLVKG
jgi:hypothetical protein